MPLSVHTAKTTTLDRLLHDLDEALAAARS